METIYLDHSATTPVDPEVLAAMMPFFGFSFGNPSSIHDPGRRARQAVEQARSRIAETIGAEPGEIIFTSGGTEADNLALIGTARAQTKGRNHLITTAIEHPAVLNACRHLETCGFVITYLPVNGCGLVDQEDVRKAITDKTFLVSVMHANNEIGTVEPLDEIARITREAGLYLHTDAVQTIGKIPVRVDELPIDLLSLAGHKIHGPKGVGALYVRKGVDISPLTFGGHQEAGLRAGTENVPGIVGLGKACEIAFRDLPLQMVQMKQMRDGLEARILHEIQDVHVNSHPLRRTPHILSVSFAGIPGDAIVREMDKKGVAISAGSACTSESAHISHVLTAMNMQPELAMGTVRFSLGRGNNENEVVRAAEALAEVVETLKKTMGCYR